MGKKRLAKWATTIEPKLPVVYFAYKDDEEMLKLESCSQKVHEAISFLPRSVRGRVGNELIFRIEHPAVLATYFPKSAKASIRLKGELFNKTFPEIAFIIGHEVAHFIKDHHVLSRAGDIDQRKVLMDNEADELAITWLKGRFPEETLREFTKIPKGKKQ